MHHPHEETPMETFHHENLTISFTDEGSGPSIVMLHNGGTSSTIWRHQASDLAADCRVITVDLPGFGNSPQPAQAPQLSDLVNLVAALMHERAATPALLVGNCMGTNIASGLARQHPEMVTGVLAINPLTEVSFAQGQIGFLHTMKRKMPLAAKALRSISRHIRVPSFIAPLVLRFQLGPEGVKQKLHHDPYLLACQTRADQLPALIDVLNDMNAYGGLDSTRIPADIPTWVMWGEKNRVLSRKSSAHIPDLLNTDRVDALEGCGHLAMLENPEAVTAAIRELLHESSTETAATNRNHAS